MALQLCWTLKMQTADSSCSLPSSSVLCPVSMSSAFLVPVVISTIRNVFQRARDDNDVQHGIRPMWRWICIPVKRSNGFDVRSTHSPMSLLWRFNVPRPPSKIICKFLNSILWLRQWHQTRPRPWKGPASNSNDDAEQQRQKRRLCKFISRKFWWKCVT